MSELLSSKHAHDVSAAERGVVSTNGAPRLSTPSTPSRDRISEYERALTPSLKKKPEGPAFEVVRKNRKLGDKGSSIEDLPNGMLQSNHYATERVCMSLNVLMRPLSSDLRSLIVLC